MEVSCRKNLFLLYGISFFQGMVFYAPIATLYRQNSGLDIFQISLIESISLVLCVILEFPWGVLADRIGYRKTMIFCTAVFFLSKIIFWQADDFTGFLVERIFLSVAVAGLSGVDTSFLYLSVPDGQFQKACGIYESMGTAGLLFSSLIFTLFLKDNYRGAGFFTVLTYGAAFVLSLFLSRLPGNPSARSEKHRNKPICFRQSLDLLKNFFASRRLLLFLAGTALLSETRQNITVFFNQLQYIRCGLSESVIGILFLLTSIAGLAGAASSAVTRKIGEFALSSACFLFPAFFCFLLSWTENPFLSAVCIIGIQLAVSLFYPLQSRFQNEEIHVSNRASALSLQAVFLECTGAIVSPVYGCLADVSLPISFLAASAACLAGYLLFLFWYKKRSAGS